MTETADQQRERLLNASGVDAWTYDLALALGYQPESWDGMWKLTDTADQFTYRNGCVITREAVYDDADKIAPWLSSNAKTRLVAHPLPEGWRVVDNRRLTDAEPHYMYVSPRR